MKSSTLIPNKKRQRRRQQQRLTSFFRDGEKSTITKSSATTTNEKISFRPSLNYSNAHHSQQQQQPPPRNNPPWNNEMKCEKKNLTIDGSRFGSCPLCQNSFPWHKLESHAASCDGISEFVATGGPNESSSSSKNNTATNSNNNSHSLKMTGLKKQSSNETIISRPNYEMADCESSTATARLNHPSSSSSSCMSNKKERLTGLCGMSNVQSLNELQPTSEPIPGLFLFEDFITPDEEQRLLHGLDHDNDSLPWKIGTFNGRHFGKRWGVHCNLRDRRVDAPEHPLPNILQQIILPKLKFLPFTTMKGCIPNEANAIDYRRSQGHWLQAHVDDRKLSKEPIVNLSLAGDCYMTFTNQAKHRNLAISQKRVLLKRRCLQVLTGKARYDFSHAIAPHDLLTDRRVSITMRESPLTTTVGRHPTTTIQTTAGGGIGNLQDLWKKQVMS